MLGFSFWGLPQPPYQGSALDRAGHFYSLHPWLEPYHFLKHSGAYDQPHKITGLHVAAPTHPSRNNQHWFSTLTKGLKNCSAGPSVDKMANVVKLLLAVVLG